MSFEGHYVQWFVYNPSNDFSEALLQLTKTCKELRNIEFDGTFLTTVEAVEACIVYVKTLLWKVKAIDRITIRCRYRCLTFDNTLFLLDY